MAKIRVHELAKEVNVPSKELVGIIQNLGIEVKNHMSTMEDQQADWVKRKLKEPVQVEKKEEPKTKVSGRPTSVEPEKSLPTAPPVKHTPTNKPTEKHTGVAQQPMNSPRPIQGRPVERRTEPPKDRAIEENRPTPPQGTGERRPEPPRDRINQETRPVQQGSGERRPEPPRDKFNQDRRPAPPVTGERRPEPPRDRINQERSPAPQGTGERRPEPPRDRNNQDRRPAPQSPGERRPEPSRDRGPQEQGGAKPYRPEPARPTGDNRPSPVPSPRQAPPVKRAGGEVDSEKNFAPKLPVKTGQTDMRPKTFGGQNFQRPPHRGGKGKKKTKKPVQRQEVTPEVIEIGERIIVRDLAERLVKSPADIVKKLMLLNINVSLNNDIDYEMAELIAADYNVRVEKEKTEEELILEEIVDDVKKMRQRPPVVTVMGHVDHGKTSLLDAIRETNVVSKEAGGITQHIGAYQVEISGEKITFIDTPGHEAFTAMRSRGAQVTDIAVLVVAADDGVMPQTIEAINHAKAAEVPILVAVNKIDKENANPDRVKQQLTEYNLVPEDWGGDTIFSNVSAKSHEGIEHLLEMLLLLAEMKEIKADPDRPSEGVVIEGQLDKGRGPVASVLVLKGTLKIGDTVICGTTFGKVRAMVDDLGNRVNEAGPSMPVEVLGLTDVPMAGDKFMAVDEKVARQITSLRVNEKKREEQSKTSKVSLDDFFKQMKQGEVKELNLIVKGDVQGSVEAMIQSLRGLSTDEVQVNVINWGVGAITESDVMLASASKAIIIGFNVRPDTKARKNAEEEEIDVRLYRVIYEAIDDVKKAMAGLLEPEHVERFQGRAEVRATFKVPKAGVVAGSYVIDGKISRNANIRVLRDGVIIFEGKLSSLKRFKDDAKEVASGFECGMGIDGFNDLKEGDIIETYTIEDIPRQL